MFQFSAQRACRALRLALPAALLVLPSVLGQTASVAASQGAPARDEGSFATTVEEVSLDLVVRTKGNKPITDLKSSDFTITDNGSPVTLSDLHLVTDTTQSQHIVTLVFDRLEAGPAKNARNIAQRILKAIPEKGYTYAVLQMNGRLRLIQPYTGSRDAVEKAVETATDPHAPNPEAGLSAQEKDLISLSEGDALSVDAADRAHAKLLLTGMDESQRILEEQHDYPSLSALLALARTQRQITGRKLILYFAQGLNANSDTRDTIRSIVGQANRAGVTICAVDTLALNQQASDKMMGAMAMAGLGGATGPGSAISSANALGSAGYARGVTGGPPIGQVMDAAQNQASFEFGTMDDVQSPLVGLASGTGGIYIRAGASLKKPLQELHDNLTSYYEASYTPNIKSYNGQFRPIAIQPLRKNLLIRSRAGYFAVPPENGSGIRPFEVPLLNILAGSTLPTALEFQSSVLHLGQLPDGNTGALTVQVPVSELAAHEDATTHLSSVHLSIVAVIKNQKGDVLQRFSDDVPMHEAPDMLRNDPSQAVTMQRHFSAQPGTYTLETAVLDRLSSKAGAQRTTFTIDAVPHGPAISDIALVRDVEPLHQDETATFEPMRYMNGRIVPNLSAELPERTHSLSVFFMVHPIAGSATQPQLEMQILRNRELLGKMPLELHKVSDTGNAIPYLGTIQGSVFPPGNYQVKVVLSQDGQSAENSASFSVEGTIADSTAPAASFAAYSDTGDLASDRRLTANAATTNSHFVIASPTNPVPPPTEAEVHDVIEGARQRALAWSDSLPNFFCMEITDHSIDSTGHGDWHHKDTMVQLMRYVDHQESRSTLQLNGQPSSVEPDQLDFAHSVGEFGGMFQLVFAASAKANFAWKESDVLDGQPVQVFAFKVAVGNSNFDLTGLNNRQHAVPFHGLVYLDTATRSVRRISIDADDIPENLQVRASSISVDYGWVTINNHDYLLPIRGAVSLREGKHQAVLNEFEFRNYRRFGAQIRILTKEESKNLPGY